MKRLGFIKSNILTCMSKNSSDLILKFVMIIYRLRFSIVQLCHIWASFYALNKQHFVLT